ILRKLVRIAPILSILAAPAIAMGQPELSRVLSRLLAPPTIQVETGFKAHLLVPPGLLYDPLFMIPRPNGVVWLNDDGGEENESGGPSLGVTHEEKHSVRVGVGQ